MSGAGGGGAGPATTALLCGFTVMEITVVELAAMELAMAAVRRAGPAAKARMPEGLQQRETALLAVVEGLMEGRQRVGIVPARGAALSERVGPPLRTLHGIEGCAVVGVEATMAAGFGEFATGVLERRPRLLVLRRQLQSGVKRRGRAHSQTRRDLPPARVPALPPVATPQCRSRPGRRRPLQ